MDHLCELPNDAARRKALDSLPPTLHATYERILHRVNRSNKEVQRLVQRSLRWLVCSFAKLSSSALCDAVTIEIGDTDLDRNRIVEEEEILRWCSSLVRRSAQKDCLELAHFTVKEFLMAGSDRRDREFDVYHFGLEIDDTCLAERCLTYLSFQEHKSRERANEKPLESPKNPHTFRQYAVLYWWQHAQNSLSKPVVSSLTQKLLHPSKQPIFVSWAHDFGSTYGRCFDSGPESLDLNTASPLHFASMLALSECCEWLLQKGCRVNQPSAFGTPLECALLGSKALHCPNSTGFVQSEELRRVTVKLLIASGADIHRGSLGHTSPMFIALSADDKDSCIELLCKGASFDTKATEELSRSDRRDLACAIWEGVDTTSLRPKDRTKLLNAAIHSENFSEDGPPEFLVQENQDVLEHFLMAAEFGELAVVKKILEGDRININAKSLDQSSALHLAASNDHVDIEKLLIDNGADYILTDLQGRTPLHASVEKHDARQCLEFLLGLKFDVNDGDEDGLTVWHIAALEGNIHALKILKDFAADGQRHLNFKANDGQTLLHCAAQSSSKETLIYLIDHFSQDLVHDTTSDGSTALHYAVKTNSLDAVQFLIDRELDIHAVTNDGSGTLHCAVCPDSEVNLEIIELLLERGVDPCKIRKDGMTPIHLLLSGPPQSLLSPWVSDEFETLLRLLSQYANSLDVTNEVGSTALHQVCQLGRTDPAQWRIVALRSLFQNGANPNLRDRKGRTPLEYVGEACKKDIIAGYILTPPLVIMIKEFLYSTSDMAFRSTMCTDPLLLILILVAGDEELAFKVLGYNPSVDLPIYDVSGLNSLEVACHYGCSRQLLEELLKRSKVDLNAAGSSSRLLVPAFGPRYSRDKGTVLNLLDLGADPNERTVGGVSALMSAAGAGDLVLVEILIQHGADVSAKNDHGWSLIHYALESRNEKLWHFLRHVSTDWNAMIEFVIGETWWHRDATALHLAAKEDSNALEFLLKCNLISDINHGTQRQETALYLAVDHGILRNVDLLLGANADVTIAHLGHSPLHQAAWNGDLKVVKIFANRGKDLNLRNSLDFTPELVARKEGHLEVAQFLKEKTTASNGSKSFLNYSNHMC